MYVPRKLSLTIICFLIIATFSFAWHVEPVAAAALSVGTASELIAAINAANLTPEADVITLTASITLNDSNYAANITNGRNGLPNITSEIIISGNGFTITRDTSSIAFRFFQVSSTGKLWLDDITLTGGYAFTGTTNGNSGGAILNSLGEITLTNTYINENTAFARGGAIASNAGTLLITDSFITDNAVVASTTSVSGGGLYIYNGSAVYLTRSAIENNRIQADFHAALGAGVLMDDSSILLNQSSISNNQARAGGGGVAYGGGIEVTAGQVTSLNSQISGNSLIGLTEVRGGGIRGTDNGLQIILRDSIVDNNSILTQTSTSSGNTWGGGIAISGATSDMLFTMENSSVSGNEAISEANGDGRGVVWGGGILGYSPINVQIVNSTIANNVIQMRTPAGSGICCGGGIFLFGGSNQTIENTTISGNRLINTTTGSSFQRHNGAGIYANVAQIRSSTITNNQITGNLIYAGGAGALLYSGVNVSNTVFANNTIDGVINDCQGSITSIGYNQFTSAGCSGLLSSDILDTTTMLGVLADNGGPTLTHSISSTPPINSANPAVPGSDANACLTTDQRGALRNDARCDIGAYEAGAVVPIFNNAPVGFADTAFVTITNMPYSGNVLLNDFDADNDPLTTYPASPPANGSVAVNADGSFTYTPFSGYNGADRFTYVVCDDIGYCTEPIMVTIQIGPTTTFPQFASNPAPDSVVTLTGAAGSIQTTTLSISNVGDAGSILNVFRASGLSMFGVGPLPIMGLLPIDGTIDLTIGCTVPQASEVLTLQSNEPGDPTYDFTLECVASDVVLPTVSSTTPTNNTFNVALTTDAVIYFSEPVTTVAVSAICDGTPRGLIGHVGSTGVDSFTYPASWLADTTCTVSVSASTADGRQLDGNGDGIGGDNYVFTFTTQSIPNVTSTLPTDGTVAVALDAPLTINFDEAVDLTAAAITVECPDGSAMNFSGLPTTAVTSVTLTPTAPSWFGGVNCVVTVSASEVIDKNGNPLDGNSDGIGGDDYTFSFTTEPIVAVPIYSSNPAPGSTITLSGATGSTQSTIIALSNIGDNGSLLDVTQVGSLTSFSISGLPAGQSPSDDPYALTISCTVPRASETLTLQSNEAGNPTYTYTLECLASDSETPPAGSCLTPPTQVTSNTVLDSVGAISSPYVVWFQSDGTTTYDLQWYNLDTGGVPTTFWSQPAGDSFLVNPAIDGDTVVWSSGTGLDSEIYLYDISSGATPINISQSVGPANIGADIDGNYVVWSGGGLPLASGIYLYDISVGGTPIDISQDGSGNSLGGGGGAEISGNYVVWSNLDSSGYEVYLYDIGTGALPTQIFSSTADGTGGLHIEGNYILWHVWEGTATTFYLYDISAGGAPTSIWSENGFDFSASDIDGNYVVLSDINNGNAVITLYNISTGVTTPIYVEANATSSGVYPSIDGQYVVWRDIDGGAVYVYDISEGSTVSLAQSTPGNLSGVHVDGNYIVWSSYDADSEVFFYDMKTCDLLPPPTVITTNPLNGAVDVPGDTSIVINFSESIERIGFSLNCPASGMGISLSESVNNDTYTLPFGGLVFSGSCTVTVSATTTDGRQLDGNSDGIGGDEYVFSFTVAAPEITPEVTPEITPEVTPEVTPEITPEITPEVTPEITPEVTPEITPEVTPEMTPEITPEVTPEVTPEITPEVTPEITPEVTPEITPEVTPEITPEITPEVTPEVTPEITPEVTPEVTPEITPEVTPEITPEVTPEVTPEITPEITPEVTVEPTAEVTDNPVVTLPTEDADNGELQTAQIISVFDPAISKIGFLLPGQVGVTGEQLEWVVTVNNPGTVAGNNVIVSDTLIPALRIDSVDAPGATVTINGQNVTVTYAVINPGQSVQFSIFTTVLQGVEVENIACVNATNQAASECATGLAITSLPHTGESPFWRKWLWLLLLVPCLALPLLRRRLVR